MLESFEASAAGTGGAALCGRHCLCRPFPYRWISKSSIACGILHHPGDQLDKADAGVVEAAVPKKRIKKDKKEVSAPTANGAKTTNGISAFVESMNAAKAEGATTANEVQEAV